MRVFEGFVPGFVSLPQSGETKCPEGSSLIHGLPSKSDLEGFVSK